MTTKPELRVGRHLLPGLAAVALFVVMTAAVLRASFDTPRGFGPNAGITESIGYAMFNLDMGSVPGEGFLVALIIVAVALDAALDGSLLLAKREKDGSAVALLADGGRRLRDRVTGTAAAEPETADDDDGGER